jgi:N-methylhydantoinase A/oxoprolinase/acetone carboxylase beta subunit
VCSQYRGQRSPAATACFGAKATAAKLAMVVDIGGTTTDITFIKKAKW